jgi:hypothetical protein
MPDLHSVKIGHRATSGFSRDSALIGGYGTGVYRYWNEVI